MKASADPFQTSLVKLASAYLFKDPVNLRNLYFKSTRIDRVEVHVIYVIGLCFSRTHSNLRTYGN